MTLGGRVPVTLESCVAKTGGLPGALIVEKGVSFPASTGSQKATMKRKKSRPHRKTVSLILPAALWISGSDGVEAQLTTNRYWDPASGGNFGAINNTTQWVSPLNIVWTNSSNGSTTRLQNFSTSLTDICNFGGPMPPASPTNPLGGGTIPVGTVNAGWLSFNNINGSGTVTLSGGTITLNANARLIANAAAQSHTISSTLAGAGTSLEKRGPGTIVLSGSNSFAGPTAIIEGRLTLANSSALANSPLNTTGSIAGDADNGLRATVPTLTLGGLSGNKDLAAVFTTTSGGFDAVTALTLNPGNAVTASYSGAIADGAAGMSLTKNGLGTQVLSGANTFTGPTTLNAGTLSLDYGTQDNSKLSDSGALVLGSGTIEISGGSHVEVVGSTTVNGNATVTRTSGSAVLALGAVTGTGTINFSADGIATTTTPNNALGILPFATIGGSNLAAADGSGNIVSFTGYADIDARGPSTVPDNSNALVRILGDGTSGNIDLAAATTTIFNLLQTNANHAAVLDTAGKTLAATALSVGATAESLSIGANVGDGTLRSAETGGTLVLTNSNPAKFLTVNAAIIDNGGASGVATAGAGTVVLAGANTHTGTTLAGAGTLQLTGSLSGSAVSVAGSAVLNQTATGVIAGAVNVTHDSTGASTLAGANSYSGATAINAGSVNIQHASALGDTSAGTTVASGAALQIQGDITVGDEPLTLGGTGVGGTGALRNISGTNTYGGLLTLTGSTHIISNAGTLTLSNPGTIGGDTFPLVVGGAGDTVIQSILGTTTGTLDKQGSGKLTLTGANTFTGTISVTAGVLNLQNDAAAGATAGGVGVVSGAALQLEGGITVGNEALTLVGTGVSNTGSLRNISGDNTWGGLISLNVATRFQCDAGTLILDVPSGNAIAGTGVAAATSSNVNMTFGGNGDFRVADPINSGNLGTGILTKEGTGTLTLAAANSYTGPTVVAAGLIQLDHAQALQLSPLDTTNTVAGDAANGLKTTVTTLSIGGLIGSKNLADVFTTTSGGYDAVTALTLNPGLARSYAGVIADGAAGMTLTKSGAGVQTFTGAHTYTGATTISGGTLKLDGAASIATTPMITVGSGAGLDVSTLDTAMELGAGQTLRSTGTGANASGTLTTAVGKDLTLSAAGLVFSAYGGANGANAANAPLSVTGSSEGELKLNGAPVTLTTSTLLAPGNYVLIAKAGSAAVTGTPGTLTIAGAGVDGGATLAVTGGQLVLSVSLPGYAGWVDSYPGLTNDDSSVDFDGDGLTTGIEYVVGGVPDQNDAAAVAPTAVSDSSGIVFTFRRTDLAKNDAAADISVRYSSDLITWTPAVHGANGITIQETDDFYAPAPDGIDRVVVTLPSSLAVNDRLFARLAVTGLPVTLLNADFESGAQGFTAVSSGGSIWEYGTPASADLGGGAVNTANSGSGAWGTVLGGPYVAATNTKLRSPVIDLTGIPSATLSFAQAIDIRPGDTLVVNVIDDDSDTVLQSAIHTSSPDPNISAAPWTPVAVATPITGNQKVRIEWHFTGEGTSEYLGAYIDDVLVRSP